VIARGTGVQSASEPTLCCMRLVYVSEDARLSLPLSAGPVFRSSFSLCCRHCRQRRRPRDDAWARPFVRAGGSRGSPPPRCRADACSATRKRAAESFKHRAPGGEFEETEADETIALGRGLRVIAAKERSASAGGPPPEARSATKRLLRETQTDFSRFLSRPTTQARVGRWRRQSSCR